ncbi:MAG: ribosomal-processing cysteine protease Prp [Butyricicoccus sp.]|nr:ribosomal-processing cysteine protease Prp [Butyricicoccus sp.]
MIRVIGCHRENVFVLTMHGHAGYAEKGQDIVCAGASALLHSLIATLRLLEVPHLHVELQEGCARVSCRIESVTVHALFYQALVGMILLQQEYPENIRVNTAGFFEGDLERETETEEEEKEIA